MPASDGPDADEVPDDESTVIAALRAGARGLRDLRIGIGDDAAVFDDGRVVTVDTLVEGVHWDARLSPADVGWKLVAVNVSDVAAMGARPEWAVLALSLPSPLDRAWVSDFADGVAAACARWNVALIGGDTTRSPTRVATLTVGGRALRPVFRSGGLPGDDVWVTGNLGLAAEGFLADAPRPEATARLRRPEPRVSFAVALAERGLAHAMMDLSDGLRADLARLCAASRCGASIDPDAVPGPAPLAWRVAFGDDYELLFTAAAECRDAVRSLGSMEGIPLTRVGRLDSDPSLRLVNGAEWPSPLFDHFPRREGGDAPSRGAP